MTNILLRLFIKDHANATAPAVRARIGKFAGIIGILCNLLLAIGKITVGVFFGIISITADGLNNLSDMASSVIAFIGFRLSQQPADRDHPYGHGRFEHLSALGVAVLILLMGGELVKASVGKILSPVPSVPTLLVFLVLTISILIKLWMLFFFKALYRRTASGVLLAAAQDSRNDVLATTAVLAGCILKRAFDLNIDGYIGLAVAIFVLFSGFCMIKETSSPLLGTRADNALTEGITALILAHERILGIHDLLIHDYGAGQCYATVHAEISASEDTIACHALIDSIEEKALSELNVRLVIHYDPVIENDAEHDRMRAVIDRLLFGIAPELSIHDFRIAHSEEGSTLFFDVSIPYSMQVEEERIKAALDSALAEGGHHYATVIRFDAY